WRRGGGVGGRAAGAARGTGWLCKTARRGGPALHGGIVASGGSLARLFGRWMAAGRLAADLGSPGDLAYALMAPVALARVLWLHNGARLEEIEAARERAGRHAELFIKAVFC